MNFIYHSDGLTSLDGGYHNNEAGVNDPHLDALLNEGPATSDPAKQKQIYDEAQQIVSDKALAAPLYVYPSIAAFNTDKVRDVRNDWSVHSVTLYDAWVPKN
jgi:peptide/nickel transport system substrate-binding protein